MDDTLKLRFLLGGVVILFLAPIVLRRVLSAKQDIIQPPSVPALVPIPFFGHVIGLLWERTAYYSNLSKRWNYPIFSISMFGGKVNVISSPELMNSLHRIPKVVSFWFIEAQFTVLLGGFSKRSADNLTANLAPTSRNSSLLIEGLKATQQAMSPQGGVEEMNRVAAKVIAQRLDALSKLERERKNVDLWAWVQHEITLATTESVYGPANPYRDERVETGFWDFADDTINLLMTNYLPYFIATKALAGRKAVVEGFERYFASGSHSDGSSLVKARYAALQGHIDDKDLARFECVNGIAILANTVPTAFWTIYHIFCDASILAEVRRQVTAITSSETSPSGHVRTIDLRKLKDAPIIFSAIQESLRLRATGTGPRMVMEDVFVGSQQYLLKKDSVVIITNQALHFDKTAWGDTADRFIAERFCGKTPTAAFRGFGGGINMCPGKGFAMMEVAALVAMLAMRFDLFPEASADWSEPGQDMNNMSLQIAPPRKQVKVDIVPKAEEVSTLWRFSL